jgi:heme/copper-type cytochrome/quinol oxidase subunit 2
LLEIFKRHITSEQSDLIRELETAVMNVIDFLMTIDKTFNGFKTLHDRDVEIVKDIPLRLTVDCNLIIAKDPKFLRLLSTDQCLVLPSKTPIRLLITSNDVIHSWAIPSYGVKVDAVPGRINQQILNVPLNGTSWGQCSELCGVNHAYMPIEVKMLHFADFLFFMELKLKEILIPYFTQYYTSRVDVLKNFIKFMSESLKNGTLSPVFFNKDFLEVLTNAKNIIKYTK